MFGSERAFTYEPGQSLLHRWADRDASLFRVRLASKICVVFTLAYIVAQLHDRVGAAAALLADIGIIAIALALLAASTSRHKARALALEIWLIARLTAFVALPVLALVLGVAKALNISIGYSFRELPLVFALLAVTVSTLLSLSALFMATTSLADIVSAIPGSGRVRTFVSLTLVALAQAEPNIVQRQIALRGLRPPSTHSKWVQFLLSAVSAPGTLFYLLAALVWQVLAVDSVPIYLTLRAEVYSFQNT